jgi:hypothetical protein
MQHPQHHNAVIAKYLPKTGKISLTSKRFNKRITISFDRDIEDNLITTVSNYLITKGFIVSGYAVLGDDYIILTETFQTL